MKKVKRVYTYFKINPTRTEYLGKRFFKMEADTFTQSIIQVVVHPGQERKGRGHTFGVYLISRMTFFSNYLAMDYAIPCTKKEYEKHLVEVLNILVS